MVDERFPSALRLKHPATNLQVHGARPSLSSDTARQVIPVLAASRYQSPVNKSPHPSQISPRPTGKMSRIEIVPDLRLAQFLSGARAPAEHMSGSECTCKKTAIPAYEARLRWPLSLNIGVLFALGVTLASWLAAVSRPNSYRLTAFGNVLQVALVLAATLLSFVNFLRGHSRIGIFWLLIFVGMGLWTASDRARTPRPRRL